MNPLPLVSCLCVTRNRVSRLKRAIDCFNCQTYPNRELLIICEDNDKATLDYLSQLNSPDIKQILIETSPKKKLGELRNIAIEKADGEYFCQWDDDDWYHCERIERQITAAIKNFHPGSILTNWMMYDEQNKQAYFSWIRWWEGSILYKKDILINKEIRYPSIEKSEDTVFVQDLVNKSRILPLVSPPIYIYTCHGENTWERDKFEHHFRLSQKLSVKTSAIVRKILDGEYSNQEGSRLLFSPAILEEINFFHALKTSSADISLSVVSRN